MVERAQAGADGVPEILAGVERILRRDRWLFMELGRYAGDEEEISGAEANFAEEDSAVTGDSSEADESSGTGESPRTESSGGMSGFF
jgi:hypothetical protein